MVTAVEAFSPSKLTIMLFLKLLVSLYWFSRDRITKAGELLESNTGEIGRCLPLLSMKPLPFVMLFGMLIAVAVAFGFWCFEAAAGVSNRGTCSGFSANRSPHLTFILHQKYNFCSFKKQKYLRGKKKK